MSCYKGEIAGVPVRWYQELAVYKMRDSFSLGNRRIIWCLPTGGGKTRGAVSVMASATAMGRRCVFFATAKELVEQCADDMRAHLIPFGVVMAGHGYTRAPNQIVSKDTLLARGVRSKKIDMPPADVVIFDECHTSLAKWSRYLIEQYPAARVIGLTATPARTDGKGLAPFFQDLIVTCTIPQLIREGYLVPFKVFTHDRPDLKGVRTSQGDYAKDQLAKRVDTPALVGNLVSHWKRQAADRLTFAYATNIVHSQHIRDEFLKAGIRAEHVDGKTKDSEREDIFGRFKDGKTLVLCNVGVAVVGVDVPQASCCLHARPTKSVIVARQSWGRVMRPYPGKGFAVLLDHAGNVFRHGFPDDHVDWTLSEGEKVNDRIAKDQDEGKMRKPIECPRCRHLFSGTNVCPECQYEFPAKKRGQLAHNKDGVLVQVSGAGLDDKPKPDFDALRRSWKKALAVAASRDGTVAMAAAIFKRETGKVPWETKGLPDMPSAPRLYNELVADIFPQYDRKRSRR